MSSTTILKETGTDGHPVPTNLSGGVDSRYSSGLDAGANVGAGSGVTIVV